MRFPWRVLGAIALLIASAPPLAAQDASDCLASPAEVTCAWEVVTSERPDPTAVWLFELPPMALSITDVTIIFEGRDMGWRYAFWTEDQGGFDNRHDFVHAASGDPGELHRESNTHLLSFDGSVGYLFAFQRQTQSVETPVGTVTDSVPTAAPSEGTFHISLAATPVAAGLVPSRPAATREDPHLLAATEDARLGAYDLAAAWLDDAALGDGIMEAHLAVRDLSDFPYAEEAYADHILRFTIRDESFQIRWRTLGDPANTALADVEHRCYLSRNGDNVLEPLCSFDLNTSVFHASFPIRSLGEPGDGVLFSNFSARVHSGEFLPGIGGYSSNLEQPEDEASGERYAFALGGPAYWSVLNPRLDPEPVAPAAWYEAPVARDNLPDTLSVLGALLAALTFVVGFIAIRRNRRQTRALLARVDALIVLHEADARTALRELGRLESDFAHAFREGDINETQYQLAQQRVVAAASRIALRRELGLDDGTPEVLA